MDETRAQLIDLLVRHLGLKDERKQRQYANSLMTVRAIGRGWESTLRADKTADNDRKALAGAATQVERAVAILETLGWRGGNALSSADHSAKGLVEGATSFERIEETLMSISESLRAAIAIITDEGSEANNEDVRSFSPRRGSPPKHHARFVALHCARLFEIETGRLAAVRTRALPQAEAYGPFLDFVTDVFGALEIEASAETHAREAAAQCRRDKEERPEFGGG